MGLLILRVVEGNATGTELRLDEEVLLGRSAGEPGNLGNDETLSRRHARLRRGPDAKVLIEDLGSHNGTRVNGRAIDEAVALSPGDRIELGQSTLELIETDTAPLAGTDATRISPAVPNAPADAEQPTPTSPEQVTRLGRSVDDGPQPTRIGEVPAGLDAAQPTRIAGVPEEPEAETGQPTRIGRVPTELGGEVEVKGHPTRVGRVPEELREPAAAKDQATRIARTPVAPPPAPSEAQPTRLARVPSEPLGDGAAEEGAAEAVQARRVPWWKRLLRRSP